jgi:hypothetical protein
MWETLHWGHVRERTQRSVGAVGVQIPPGEQTLHLCHFFWIFDEFKYAVVKQL